MTVTGSRNSSRRTRWIAWSVAAAVVIIAVGALVWWLVTRSTDSGDSQAMSITCDPPHNSENVWTSYQEGGIPPEYFQGELFLSVGTARVVDGETFIPVAWSAEGEDHRFGEEQEIDMPACGEATLGDYGTITMISHTDPGERPAEDDPEVGTSGGPVATFEVFPHNPSTGASPSTPAP